MEHIYISVILSCLVKLLCQTLLSWTVANVFENIRVSKIFTKLLSNNRFLQHILVRVTILMNSCQWKNALYNYALIFHTVKNALLTYRVFHWQLFLHGMKTSAGIFTYEWFLRYIFAYKDYMKTLLCWKLISAF